MRRATVLIVSTLLLNACATLNVSSHVERGIEFRQFTTFGWGTADALPTGDPRLDSNPFFHDHFQGAVEKALAARGLTGPVSSEPDLLLHYHANVSQRFSVAGIDREYGGCAGDDCQPRVNEYEAGTLVLDVVDARTNRVVWRGWAQQNVDGVLDDQDALERYITRGVTRMVARFPAAGQP